MNRSHAVHARTTHLLTTLCVLLLSAGSMPAQARSAAGTIEKMDQDGDGKLTRDEWEKKKKFKMLDLDGDGYITLRELKIRFGEPLDEAQASKMPDADSMAAIRRAGFDDVRHQKNRGLFETGLHPIWPDDVECRGIDEWYAKDYTPKRPKESYHGGIDLPVPFGTPVLSAMSGEVVALYDGRTTPRGVEVVIRHTPEESGLPLYLYTRYTHFERMPDLHVGQRIKMGDPLGPTGNSGLLGCEVSGKDCHGRSRRPAIHFDVLYSDSPDYYDTGTVLVPFNAHWMDPNALFRKSMPVDSQAMKSLPEADKAVPISYMLDSGELIPADTRMIWPYPCHKDGDPTGKSDRDEAPGGFGF